MDPLSEALRSLPLSGCLIARAELNAPWGISLSGYDAAVFHVMISGSCWMDPEGGARVHLTSGDIGVLMRGQAHTLRSAPEAATTEFADLLAHCVPDRFPTVHVGWWRRARDHVLWLLQVRSSDRSPAAARFARCRSRKCRRGHAPAAGFAHPRGPGVGHAPPWVRGSCRPDVRPASGPDVACPAVRRPRGGGAIGSWA